jgi:hypothetical protein
LTGECGGGYLIGCNAAAAMYLDKVTGVSEVLTANFVLSCHLVAFAAELFDASLNPLNLEFVVICDER